MEKNQINLGFEDADKESGKAGIRQGIVHDEIGTSEAFFSCSALASAKG